MASKNVERRTAPRKPPTVVGAFPSKLLHDCGRCGRPVFSARHADDRSVVAVEVLERRTGDVALQARLGSDELTAVVVTAPATYWRPHGPVCKGAFSNVARGKVRS